MEDKMMGLFNTYLNQEAYAENIKNSDSYLSAEKEIEEAENKLRKMIEKHYGSKEAIDMCNDFMNAYMNLVYIYRYFDFTYGFMNGTLVGEQMKRDSAFTRYCLETLTK